MNFLVWVPIGPNGNYQWIPCATIQEAKALAKITSFSAKCVIWNMRTYEKEIV